MVQDWSSRISIGRGRPLPFGVSEWGTGANFAVYAKESEHMTLVLYPSSTRNRRLEVDVSDASQKGSKASIEVGKRRLELKLDKKLNRTGRIWHVLVSPYMEGFEYMWKVGRDEDINPKWGTNLALDPYAMVLRTPMGPKSFNQHNPETFRPHAVIPRRKFLEFDWKEIPAPKIPMKELVIYEMHVRGFTMNRASHVKAPGTFLGVVEKIPYLRDLGVNCVEFLPIFEFNEAEWSKKNPVTGAKLAQSWGYSTLHFMSPMNRYALEAGELTAADEFRIMVRELHRAGIEVWLDVVFNHTAEFGDSGLPPGYFGMKALGLDTYYMRTPDGKYRDYSGCGNTLNANNTVVAEFIHNCIRYWVHEMGVDGFRFDLAAALTRDPDGRPMESPPLIERLSKDPTLRDTKLVAEAWDCAGLYLVGSFPHYGVWGEWNGKYRDSIRSFVRGNPGSKGEFAGRICGSADLYSKGRKPYHSINFVVAHDGFSLMDLVSYNNKHNEQNGEDNRDGENHNGSWNCGVEGRTHDKGIQAMRLRQIRNFLVALLISAGTPMILMGDEYGHTKDGNNNAWCQDSELTYFQWSKIDPHSNEKGGNDADARALHRFFKLMIKFRRKNTILHREDFLRSKDIVWHGAQPNQADWNSSYNFLAFTMVDHENGEDIYVALNSGNNHYEVHLPDCRGGSWFRIVDTNLASPKDFTESKSVRIQDKYRLAPWSSIILKASRSGGEIFAGGNLLRSYSVAAELSRAGSIRGINTQDNEDETRRLKPGQPAVLRESESRVDLAVSSRSTLRSIGSTGRSFSRWDLSHV